MSMQPRSSIRSVVPTLYDQNGGGHMHVQSWGFRCLIKYMPNSVSLRPWAVLTGFLCLEAPWAMAECGLSDVLIAEASSGRLFTPISSPSIDPRCVLGGLQDKIKMRFHGRIRLK